MMYLLSEEELAELKNIKCDIELENTDKLQALCTKIADTMPVRWTWGDGKTTPRPWGCIITAAKKKQEWYCDQCPVQEICPLVGKEYSK